MGGWGKVNATLQKVDRVSRFLDIISLPDSLPRVREAQGPAAGASAEVVAAAAVFVRLRAVVGTCSAAWAARLSAESAAVAASATDSST